jgi:phosphogluconate dehydratase
VRDGDIVRVCALTGSLTALVDEATWAARDIAISTRPRPRSMPTASAATCLPACAATCSAPKKAVTWL